MGEGGDGGTGERHRLSFCNHKLGGKEPQSCACVRVCMCEGVHVRMCMCEIEGCM